MPVDEDKARQSEPGPPIKTKLTDQGHARQSEPGPPIKTRLAALNSASARPMDAVLIDIMFATTARGQVTLIRLFSYSLTEEQLTDMLYTSR